LILDADLVSPPSKVIAEVAAQVAFAGKEGRQGCNRDIVAVDRDERPVITRSGGIEEVVVVEIVATWSLSLVIRAGQQRKTLGDLVHIRNIAPADGAELALPDQSQSKI